MNIYQSTGDLITLQDMLESGEYTEEELAELVDTIGGEYTDKMEAYCRVVRNLEAKKTAHKNEATYHSDKAKTIDGSITRLKDAMFNSMKASGVNKVEGELFTVAIQKNGGKAPIVLDVEVEELPDELVKVKESADLEAIRQYIEETGDITYAHIGERGESLRIK